ncbi:hypothetical protein [Streptomyces sp. NBC_00513]
MAFTRTLTAEPSVRPSSVAPSVVIAAVTSRPPSGRTFIDGMASPEAIE